MDATVKQVFTPSGALRAAINLGNPILAHRHGKGGEVGGVSVDLARAFAERLGAELELSVFDTAGKSVQAVTDEAADIGFFAVDPVRGTGISFTAPYILIEGAYMVRQDSPLQANVQVDSAGIHITVGQGSAYDLYLSREIRQATIVRAASSQAVVDTFIERGLEVAAGVRQQLESDARRVAGVRLLPGRFMVIQQAMGLPKSRPEAAARFLADFVEEMKATGFVQQAMDRHGIEGASVAPAV